MGRARCASSAAPNQGRAAPPLARSLSCVARVGGLACAVSTDPRTLLKKLAALAPGETFALPDGAALAAEDVQSAPRRGRKVVVLGDCSDCSQIVPLGRGCGPLASAPQLP